MKKSIPSTPLAGAPPRPKRLISEPLPPIPTPGAADADQASTIYSHYRTGLSHHRTELSEHRTDLSEYRTDLSGERTEMSMHRTGMSFQRTRMSADRTLFSVIRTSLSLIGFGFTIYQAFEKFRESGLIRHDGAPRNFGLTLIAIGVLLLIGGLIQEAQFSVDLRRTRHAMTEQQLIHGASPFPVSVSMLTALALLATGLAALCSLLFGLSIFN